MKTPKFWNKKGWQVFVLAPIAFIYEVVCKWRMSFVKPYKSKAKVICIGNITAGGVGKTPVAQAMAEKYLRKGKKVFFITRGYKGKIKNILVDLGKHSVEDTGDEARLLAAVAPTIIAPNREYGAKMAEKLGAEVIIMDDGFQNPTLYKDESWLVFDGEVGIGNGCIIPSGPLRETLENGQKRAQYILIMGEDKTNLASRCQLPVYHGRIEVLPIKLSNQRVLAFAGIGRPYKFYKTLTDLGYEVVKTCDFADHYAYKSQDIEALVLEAEKLNLSLVTTEKDYVKLDDDAKKKVCVLKIRASWSKD